MECEHCKKGMKFLGTKIEEIDIASFVVYKYYGCFNCKSWIRERIGKFSELVGKRHLEWWGKCLKEKV